MYSYLYQYSIWIYVKLYTCDVYAGLCWTKTFFVTCVSFWSLLPDVCNPLAIFSRKFKHECKASKIAVLCPITQLWMTKQRKVEQIVIPIKTWKSNLILTRILVKSVPCSNPDCDVAQLFNKISNLFYLPWILILFLLAPPEKW